MKKEVILNTARNTVNINEVNTDKLYLLTEPSGKPIGILTSASYVCVSDKKDLGNYFFISLDVGFTRRNGYYTQEYNDTKQLSLKEYFTKFNSTTGRKIYQFDTFKEIAEYIVKYEE